eukprot:sb/3475558/
MMDDAIRKQMGGKKPEEMDLHELSDLEDEEDEEFLAQLREKRIAEMRAAAALAKFGSVLEISALMRQTDTFFRLTKICIVYAVREIRVCLAKDAVLLVISESELVRYRVTQERCSVSSYSESATP